MFKQLFSTGGHWFWALMALFVVVWYSTITIYVAIRGAFDIKHMLANLKRRQDAEGGK